jgi:hypothetical protein
MSTRWDFAVYDGDNKLVLVVEVKARLKTSTNWAINLYRNILSNTTPTTTPYFLMTFPDKFYLWVNDDTQINTDQPTVEVDAQPILQPYFDQSGIIPSQISGASFELVIAAWLNSVIQSSEQEKSNKSPEQWLYDTGLHRALVGGTIEYEVVA